MKSIDVRLAAPVLIFYSSVWSWFQMKGGLNVILLLPLFYFGQLVIKKNTKFPWHRDIGVDVSMDMGS